MLYNYFKMAWRSLLNDRQFAIINLLGLSISLACALLIWLWTVDELAMDHFHTADKRLYQVMQNIRHENGIETTPNTPGPLAAALKAEFPEVEEAATVMTPSWFSARAGIANGDIRMKANAQFASAGFFRMFSYPVLSGDTARLFNDGRTIAISDELAARLFPGVDPIGRSADFQLDEFSGKYVVTAVFAQAQAANSQPFDILLGFESFLEKRAGLREWGNSDPATYVLLRKDADLAAFTKKLEHFFQDRKQHEGSTLFARPFADRYLYGQYENGVRQGGRIAYVRLFTLIAVFILFIACINFMNLSTARAARRMKETGIRKAAGATRGHLVLQHLGESMLMSVCAGILALLFIGLLLPAFNQFTGKSLVLRPELPLVLTMLAIILITGLLAGSYPAWYISRFRPVAALKGSFKAGNGEAWIRKGLVVFQFALSVAAICAVLVIYRQVRYIQHKHLGYDRSHIIHFEIPLEMEPAKLAAAESFVGALRQLPGVTDASSYGHNLLGKHGEVGDLQWPGKPSGKGVNLANLEVGFRFLQTTGIQLKAGRYFSESAVAQQEIIFNETAIRQMGLPDPIGKTVRLWDQDRRIVGIAADFNFESLYNNVGPCFFQTYPVMPNIIVKLGNGDPSNALTNIRQTFDQFFKGHVFEFSYMDDEYQAMYASEHQVAVLSRYFTALAVLISCLGLFGLAAFTAQKRRKEIGIRKVLGATVGGVVLLLWRDFLKLLLLAALIAFPLVWYVMREWLDGFAYRVRFGADVFLIAGGAMVAITLLTISFQSIKAALANPVQSLRQ
ncbi:ABC transporter permease [Chitinophaga sp. NPDC101104]|uniref:ABC transporter permease n=1 Tax=Chitinophaga sp. NPDC101104 TaxID=3390561 RepID=UPI003CFF96D4